MTAVATAVVPGDRELLARVLSETGAQTQLPEPALSDYVRAAGEQFAAWLIDQLRPVGALLHVSSEVLSVVAWLILALVASVLVLILMRLAPRRQRTVAPPGSTPDQPAAAPVPADAWAEELQRRLLAGQPRAALEALWWWLARSLAGHAVETSWTTRELLASVRRTDLGSLGRTLDRQLYGAAEPALDEVRVLASRLREAL